MTNEVTDQQNKNTNPASRTQFIKMLSIGIAGGAAMWFAGCVVSPAPVVATTPVVVAPVRTIGVAPVRTVGVAPVVGVRGTARRTTRRTVRRRY